MTISAVGGTGATGSTTAPATYAGGTADTDPTRDGQPPQAAGDTVSLSEELQEEMADPAASVENGVGSDPGAQAENSTGKGSRKQEMAFLAPLAWAAASAAIGIIGQELIYHLGHDHKEQPEPQQGTTTTTTTTGTTTTSTTLAT